MKYIILKNAAGIQMCLMFDAHIRHKDVVYSLEGGHDIIAAGVCRFTNARRVEACGESRSLDAFSRPEDGDILTKFLFQ